MLSLAAAKERDKEMTVATIGKLVEILPIEGADRIEAATVVCGKVGKWSGVVQRGQLHLGDLVEVYLQDCIVPSTERFAFMEARKYIVRMVRLRGVPSECLIMPLSEMFGATPDPALCIGADISEVMHCEKYEKPLPANMSGEALGNFPAFVPKTDELNFQAAPHLVNALIGHAFYITEKADGSSATVFRHVGHFGCCSRNLELKETENNSIWRIARQYDLEHKLPNELAIQFEVVGPGIQGNPMGLKAAEPRLFNVYDISDRRYYGYDGVLDICKTIEFPMVSLDTLGDSFPSYTDEELRRLAEGVYPNGKRREGIVIRPTREASVMGERVSFKVINLQYKDKGG